MATNVVASAAAAAAVSGIDLIVGHQFKLDLPAYLPAIHELKKRSVPDIHYTKTMARGDFDLPHFAEPDSTGR